MNNVKILFLMLASVINSYAAAQTYDAELNYLGQYVQRMYFSEPFQGVKVVSDVDKCYLVCVVVEAFTNNEYTVQRKSEVKAMRYANEFLNGTQISSNTIVLMKEDSDGNSYEEIEDFIESRSIGYVQQMQLLSTFEDNQGKTVFVFCKELPVLEFPKGKKGKRTRKK